MQPTALGAFPTIAPQQNFSQRPTALFTFNNNRRGKQLRPALCYLFNTGFKQCLCGCCGASPPNTCASFQETVASAKKHLLGAVIPLGENQIAPVVRLG
jgi:hypothetical protein